MIIRTVGQTIQHDLELLTGFGDTAVLLPLSLVFFIWLLTTHRLSIALIWLAIVVACNFVIAALKLYFLSCPAGEVLRSPSGHTGFGILVYGSVTLVLALSVRWRWLRRLIVVLGTGLAVAIALSRLLLRNHSLAEIVIGAAIGGVSLVLFARLYRPGGGRRWSMVALAAIMLIVALIFHGEQVKAEGFLRDLGIQLGLRGEVCRYR